MFYIAFYLNPNQYPFGWGQGIVELNNGKMKGNDDSFTFTGLYEQTAHKISGNVEGIPLSPQSQGLNGTTGQTQIYNISLSPVLPYSHDLHGIMTDPQGQTYPVRLMAF